MFLDLSLIYKDKTQNTKKHNFFYIEKPYTIKNTTIVFSVVSQRKVELPRSSSPYHRAPPSVYMNLTLVRIIVVRTSAMCSNSHGIEKSQPTAKGVCNVFSLLFFNVPSPSSMFSHFSVTCPTDIYMYIALFAYVKFSLSLLVFSLDFSILVFVREKFNFIKKSPTSSHYHILTQTHSRILCVVFVAANTRTNNFRIPDPFTALRATARDPPHCSVVETPRC